MKLYGSIYERFILMWDQCVLHIQTDDKDCQHNPYHTFIYEILIYYFCLFVKYPMQKFHVIWSAKFSNLYLVIFCRPFIQLLGNLEELKNKTYIPPTRVSYDLKQQDYKIGRVTEVKKISNYLCFHVLKLHWSVIYCWGDRPGTCTNKWQTISKHKSQFMKHSQKYTLYMIVE
jgi:hypothetical protein